jgi:hypothetical protein
MATATPIPTPIPGNFLDNGDGTITDTQRGLTWEKKDVSYNDSGSSGGALGSHDARGRYGDDKKAGRRAECSESAGSAESAPRPDPSSNGS